MAPSTSPPRPDRRRGRLHRADPGAPAQPSRAGPVRRHVERALLVQVVAAATCGACPPRPRRCWSARARTPGSSTPATASPWPSASRATTTPRPSSPTRGRPPVWAASSATSSPWGPGPSPSWTRSSSGRPTTPGSRWLVEGVVGGISGYGNAVGCPPSAASSPSTRCYAQNPLVNVLCMGVLPKERLVLGRRRRRGNLAVLLGSTTGRDGIGGVSVLASAGFGGDGEAEAAKRPSVQVGDPYEEKRLIEACLELLDARPRGRHPGPGRRRPGVRHQRDGGPGRRGHGRRRRRPCPGASPGMEPFEVMTCESQERMLAIVTPADLAGRAGGLRGAGRCGPRVVGRVTEPPGGHRPPAHPRRLRRRGPGRRARRRAAPRTPPSTTGPCAARPT